MVAKRLAVALSETDRRLIIYPVPAGGSVDDVMELVLREPVDAVVVTSAFLSSDLVGACRDRRIATVLFNRVQPDAEMTAVTCDNYEGGRMVARHLLSLGLERLAMVSGRRDTSTQLERARGFRDMLEAQGALPPVEAPGEFVYTTAFEAVLQLLGRSHRPGGLFCMNDLMALAAVDAARRVGIAVPEGLAIVGFDDIPMAGWESYRLTTVRQPVGQMIRDTLELIDGLSAGRVPTASIRVAPGRLIRRATA